MVLLCLVGLAFALPLHAAEAVPEPVSGPGPEVEVEVEAEPEGVPAIATAEQVITAIRFTGNRVTREQILRQEILVKEGDIADPLLIDRSRQAIMDLGLFTSVRAWLEPQEQGSVLVFAVKEKFYILPVPKLNRDDENNFSLGAELSLDNLAGLNQQLKLRYETEDADTVSGGEIATYTLSYSYPRMFGGPWLLSSELNQVRAPAEVVTGGVVTSLYESDARSASLQLSRWLNLRGPSRGWQAGGGLVWRRNVHEYLSGAPTSSFIDATAVGIAANVQFVDVRDFLYSRSGEHYGYSGEFGEPAIGSDSHYTRHEIFYRRYVLLAGRTHENIDIQWKLGLSSGEMFPGEVYAYTLGGNKTLRGFDTASFAGNAYMLLNAQYLRPLFGYPMFRGVLFVDIGNAYPSNTEMHLGDLRWDVGLGLRLRLKSFVKIDLRVDVAYAYETGEVTVFAGTKEMF